MRVLSERIFLWNFVTKFRIEAQSAAGLEHPNIVNIYDAYIMRKDINERLKTQIKDICFILIITSSHSNFKEILLSSFKS